VEFMVEDTSKGPQAIDVLGLETPPVFEAPAGFETVASPAVGE
jgi:hypothetical protein